MPKASDFLTIVSFLLLAISIFAASGAAWAQSGSTGHRLSGSSIFSNGGLGVDLNSEAPTVDCLEVTTIADAGLGSLREAIECANALGDVESTIRFAILGPSPFIISPQTALPVIAAPLRIDGTTQGGQEDLCAASVSDRPDYRIVLDGGGLPFSGLVLGAGSDGASIHGLNIRNFGGFGIEAQSSADSVITCNFIGTDRTGGTAAGNGDGGILLGEGTTNIKIGGLLPGEANLISGNLGEGVVLSRATSSRHEVRGNFIGTARSGAALLENTGFGVLLEKGSFLNTVLANTIAGNSRTGLRLEGTSRNLIDANFIGTNAALLDLGNGGPGIVVEAAGGIASTDNVIGGVGSGNVVAYNTGPGIRIKDDGVIGNALVENSTFFNNALGLDLAALGTTPNDPGDADEGPNRLQNSPELAFAVLDAAAISLTFRVDSAAANADYPLKVELFRADPSGEEGQVFLAALTYDEADAQTEISGTLIPAVTPSLGDQLIATATDSAGNTSEFSAPVLLGAGTDLTVEISESADPVVAGSGAANLVYSATVQNIGNFPATGIELETVLTLPAGVTLVSLTPSQGTVSAPTWTLGDLAVGEQATLNAVITVTEPAAPGADLISQTLAVTALNENDADAGNDAASESTSITPSLASCLRVISTADVGFGSLREAITCANASPGLDTISFAIPGTGPHVIQVLSALPEVVDPVWIDGTTQPGNETLCNAAIPDRPAYRVALDGDQLPIPGLSLAAGSDGSTVRGLNIRDFGGDGLAIESSGRHTVACNFIGTDETGTAAMGNAFSGVHLDDVARSTFGGDLVLDGNLISGNGQSGLRISDDSTLNAVENNFIGPSRDGVESSGGLANAGAGVRIDNGATGNVIGGPGVGNVIGFNALDGIRVRGTTSRQNALLENSIFLNENGIDIGDAGIDDNDPDDVDTGTNQQQNSPVLAHAVLDAGALELTYRVDSATAHSAYPLRIEVFSADASGKEGQVFLGALSYEAPDAQLEVTQSLVPAAPIELGSEILTTATDADGNTSEFSSSVVLGAGADLAVSIRESLDPAFPNGIPGHLVYTVEVVNQGNLPTTGVELESVLTLPAGVVLEDVMADRGAFSAPTWTVGDLESGGLANLTFSLTVAATAPVGDELIGLTAAITALDGEDVDPANDSAAETTSIAPSLESCLQVTSTADAGQGSLRQAIDCSNGNPGMDVITFAIPGAGPHVIVPQTELPTVLQPLNIAGASQPGNEDQCRMAIADRPSYQVVLDGDGAAFSGLSFGNQAHGSIIRALNIRGFSGLVDAGDPLSAGSAIVSLGAKIIVQCSFLGTDETGTVAAGNGYGVRIHAGVTSVIGGTSPNDANLISGNVVHGVEIVSARDVNLGADMVGTDRTGAVPLGNGRAGIWIDSSPGARVGLRSPLTVAWNGGPGIAVLGADDDAVANEIFGNSIFENGGLGIDLGGDGVTVNDAGDADAGPNALQNSPVLSDLTFAEGGGALVTYHVDADPASQSYPIDVSFFLADRDGEEGQVFLSTSAYTLADYEGCGTAPCEVTVDLGSISGWGLVATATDADHNTSEFSRQSGLLVATKTAQVVGGGLAVPGARLRYRLEVTNPGLAPLTSVAVTDALDAGTSFVQGSGRASGETGAVLEQVGGVIDITLDGPLPGLGGASVIEFDVLIDGSLAGPTASVCNQAAVTADGQPAKLTDDPGLPGTADPTCTAVTVAPDLALEIGDGEVSAFAGEPLVYELVYSNRSTVDAPDVVLSETVPAHTSFSPAASSPGWQCLPDFGVGSTCTLAAGTVPGASGPLSAFFAVTVADSLPTNVLEITNGASIAGSDANGHDPNPENDHALIATVVDHPATVLEVDTVASTSDGLLSDGESVAVPVTQIRLAFSEAVTGADADAIFLIEAGLDGVIASTCQGIQGDDQEIGVEAVIYEDPVARLELEAGLPLRRGRYRLFACADSIHDDSGQALDGDASGAAGGDFRLDFTVNDSSQLENPNFDQALPPWSSLDFDWIGEDIDQAASSGSVEALATSEVVTLLHPCIDVADDLGLSSSIAALIDAPDGDQPSVELELELHDRNDCTGNLVTTLTLSRISGDTTAAWTSSREWAAIPAGVASARPRIRASATATSSILIDRAVLIPMLFGDGFESGNTSAWSSTSP